MGVAVWVKVGGGDGGGDDGAEGDEGSDADDGSCLSGVGLFGEPSGEAAASGAGDY
jgi:hypothetical protein